MFNQGTRSYESVSGQEPRSVNKQGGSWGEVGLEGEAACLWGMPCHSAGKAHYIETAKTQTLQVRIWPHDRAVDKTTHFISVGLLRDKLLSKQQVLPSGSPFKVSLITTCVCLSVGGGRPSSPLLLNLDTRKIIIMNLFVIIYLAPSTVGGRGNWSKQKDQLKFCGGEFFSSLKIRCLANDIRWGDTWRCVMWTECRRGRRGAKNTMKSIP